MASFLMMGGDDIRKRKKVCLRVLLFLVFIASAEIIHAGRCEAQERADAVIESPAAGSDSLMRQDFVPKWYDMFSNIPNDWSRYFRLTITTEKIPAMLAMSAMTAALIYTDHETYRLSDQLYRSSSFAKSASDLFAYVGDGKVQFGLAGVFAAYGFAADDRRALRVASQTTQVILACGTVIQVIKHITGRESPFVATTPRGVWKFFPNQIEYHRHVPNYDAFPSGHIATTLATVIVVSENYPEERWMKPVGYAITGLVGLGLANTGIHWYSDFPLGIALGYSFGMLAAHPEGTENETDDHSAKLSFGPQMTSYGAGVGFILSF